VDFAEFYRSFRDDCLRRVVRTAVNLNISRWRRRRREVPVPDPGILADRPAAASAAQDPVDPQIMAALLRLPAAGSAANSS
jgi:DNA-directed RNA polymerase specialized sigma24 family protein